MRRKLWLLIILFLFLVGRESCCASSTSAQEQNQGQDIGQNQRQNIGQNIGIYLYAFVPDCVKKNKFLTFTITVLFNGLWYWIFDLHQKHEGWYTCKFYYAAGYRTKLFYNRIYLDFYYSLNYFSFLFIMMNINVRIYRDFYIVIPIPVMPILFLVVTIIATLLI